MPKENINDEAIETQRVEVSWAPDKYVQVATVNSASPFAFEVRTNAPGAAVPEPDPFDGWRVTLDRAGCNRAIRAIRRARDAAFGADA